MDKWKRNGATIYNDDETGYQNAKRRLQKQQKDKEKETLINELKKKVDILWNLYISDGK